MRSFCFGECTSFFMLCVCVCMSCRFIFLSKVFPAIDFTSKWKRSTKLHAHSTYNLNALEKTQTMCECVCIYVFFSIPSAALSFYWFTFFCARELFRECYRLYLLFCTAVLYRILCQFTLYERDFQAVLGFWLKNMLICSPIAHRISTLMAFQWFNKN